MALSWKDDERQTIQAAIGKYPPPSSKCAALARVVFDVAKPVDAEARGVLIKPKGTARYIALKDPRAPSMWVKHVLVETRKHRVDAMTGSPGCEVQTYANTYLAYADYLTESTVDVRSVDPDIEED